MGEIRAYAVNWFLEVQTLGSQGLDGVVGANVQGIAYAATGSDSCGARGKAAHPVKLYCPWLVSPRTCMLHDTHCIHRQTPYIEQCSLTRCARL